MSQERLKLVFVLPEFRNTIGTHFYHKYEFIKEIRKDIDVQLIIEKGELPEDFPNARLLYFRAPIVRAIEYMVIFWRLRRQGYRTFWVHYSFLAGILAPLFGKSFYWNCGMPWLYQRSFFEEKIFRLAMKRSLLVTGTQGLRSMYMKQYGLSADRVFVLPNWINSKRFAEWQGRRKDARAQLAIADDAKVVFFLHRLSKRKGADFIMPVADALSEDDRIMMLVAGEGPLSSEIQGKNIRLVGEIPHTDVPMYFAAADVFFMPSEEEGFPHVLLEAMASGVPIVATDVGGVREMLPVAMQEFVIDRNPEVLAAAIQKLLGNSQLHATLKEQGVTWVTQYSLEIVGHQFRKLISS